MEKIIIKEMLLEDLEKIKKVLTKEFDEFWNYNILKQELKNPNSKYIVACLDNKIVGFAGIMYNFEYVEIMNIVVRKDSRRKGIATIMLENLINISKTFNTNKIGLEVSEKNLNAIKFYEKHGFKEVGRRKKYYGNKFDAILMDFNL